MADLMPKLSCAWTFADKFYPPDRNGDRYRENWDRIFKKAQDEPSTSQDENDERSNKAQD